jgi:hypothetical protein
MYKVWGEKCKKDLIEKPRVSDNLENLGLDGRILLKWILM